MRSCKDWQIHQTEYTIRMTKVFLHQCLAMDGVEDIYVRKGGKIQGLYQQEYLLKYY